MEGWLFFDGFNTLLDDFGAAGDESGLGTLPELAVALGACAARHAFIDAYRAARPERGADEADERREAPVIEGRGGASSRPPCGWRRRSRGR